MIQKGNPNPVAEVMAERQRAHAKHADDSIEAITASDPRWLAILVEEAGEAMQETVKNYMFSALLGEMLGKIGHLHTHTAADADEALKTPAALRKELIQTMGVIWAWIDSIDLAHHGYVPLQDADGAWVCGFITSKPWDQDGGQQPEICGKRPEEHGARPRPWVCGHENYGTEESPASVQWDCSVCGPFYCDDCNYDKHQCGGCGEPYPHGDYSGHGAGVCV